MIWLPSLLQKKFFIERTAAQWDRVVVWVLAVTVFLVPIFFIPVGSYPVEFNKALCFVAATLVALLIIFLKWLFLGEVQLPRSKVFLPLGAFAVFYLLSFVFSKSIYYSTVGVSGFFSGGAAVTASFLLFFFIVQMVVKSEREMRILIGSFLMSSFLALVHAVLQTWGVYLLPWPWSQEQSFNLIGSSSLLLAYVTAAIALVAFAAFFVTKMLWRKFFLVAVIATALLLLLLLGKRPPMLILAVVLFIFLLAVALQSKKLPRWWVLAPTAFITVLVALMFISPPLGTFSQSVNLDHGTSLRVAWQGALARPLWGSGPQTFAFDLGLYHPASFNDSAVWNLRFIKASGEWLTLLPTIGFGAVAALALFFCWVLYGCTRGVLAAKNADGSWAVKLGIFSAIIFLLVASFAVPFNFILHYMLWFALAIGVRRFLLDERSNVFFVWTRTPVAKMVFVSATLLAVVGSVAVLLFGTRIWIGDYHYSRAQESIAATEPMDAVQEQFTAAISFNPAESKYYLAAAQGFATQALLLADGEQYDINEVKEATQRVIDSINKAKGVDPNNPAVYEQEAALYDSMRALVGNVDELSEKAYRTLIDLEPTNPLARLNIGRSRLLLAQTILTTSESEEANNEANSLIATAIADFTSAAALKSNFLAAYYNLGLAYQLQGELDLALGAFQNVLNVDQNNTEAHWQRVLIYKQQEKTAHEIAELESILTVSPGNQQALDALKELQPPAADAAAADE